MERLKDLYAMVFECDNVFSRTWFRMRHPILSAECHTRLRILESGWDYIDA